MNIFLVIGILLGAPNGDTMLLIQHRIEYPTMQACTDAMLQVNTSDNPQVAACVQRLADDKRV